jgi:UDP-N-acetylmuramoylalanine--D-glutamate ligase
VSSLVGQLDPATTVVCEASSFQLEDTEEFAPEAALLLNLEPDHLDRHLSFEAYVAAKLRIFANQDPDDIAVIPPDGMSVATEARVVRYGDGPERELVDEIRLPGEHNRQNGLAAAATCLARGIEPDAVATGLRTFPGVAHRLELIAELEGVRWVNDSKATNVSSTIVALRSYPGGVHLIAGGRGKHQDFAPLASPVAERCVAVYLIGEAADGLAAALEPAGVELSRTDDLPRAVSAAHAAAEPGDTVLLSPACASFDQYRDFEERGEHFRRLVEGLA